MPRAARHSARRPKISARPSCANELEVGAFYDNRIGSYLVTWPDRRGTVGRELTAAGAPRDSPRRVGEGQLQTLTFNSRLGRYVGVFFRHDASGAGKLQVEQLRPDGTFCAHGETLRPPRNAAIGATDIASAPNADETLLEWTIQHGGYSENSPEVDHLYADSLSGDGTHRLRRLKLDTVGTASGSIAAYDPRHHRFLVLWPTRQHGITVTYGELISGAS